MDKELLRGLVFAGGALALLAGLFLAFSDTAGSKAKCIAAALKDGVPYANIDKLCKLTVKHY
ncbi:MAG: hypothetical protein V4508_09110 [Pseudomonadota bacterium]